MQKTGLLSVLAGVLSVGLPTIASGWTGYRSADVDIDILSDRGRSYQMYPVTGERAYDNGEPLRAYLEARPGEPYTIRVRNRGGERVGLVIAVDGRNIISGKKSKLRSSERMYVLGPYQSATYKGWRTASNRVNEFYFTDELDSYAGAFGDFTAMGVIAVATFQEKQRHARRDDHRYDDRDYRSDGQGGSDKYGGRSGGKGERSAPSMKNAEPGTGFGDERYSPSRQVQFEPERVASSTWFIKYEWRETLCEKRVVSCGYARHDERNRFWPDDWRYRNSFAPYPPGRGYYGYRR